MVCQLASSDSDAFSSKAAAVPVKMLDREDPMKAYQGMNEDQLRAQVEVLLDSVASWEERVTELLQAKADEAAQGIQMKNQVGLCLCLWLYIYISHS